MKNVSWRFKNSLINPSEITEFSNKYKLSYVMATILLNRGLKSEKDVVGYIKKSLEEINNPELLPDIDIAVDRIIKAIENKEKIMIYGDYDADGVTSTSLLYKFLEKNGADVSYFIPDRIKDGYGLNIMNINKISKLGIKLLITVDCGIASFGEIELANAQKMDVIITDHHSCREKLPRALAVINPKRADSEYPFRELAGVGVAFKLVLALAKKMGHNTKECFDEYVDIAAIGTIADVVSLQGENRVIAAKGIEKLENTKNKGLKTLLDVAGCSNKKIDSKTVAFALSPRNNAAGRMESATLALELLLENNEEKAYELSVKLDEINKLRQKTEQEIFQEAIELIEEDKEFEKKNIIVLAKEGWHHGVIGIVASRICEMYYKPCILLSIEGDSAKGSGRSKEGINLFEALTFCDELLTKYGGHSQAAGLTLDKNLIGEFSQKIDKYIKDNVTGELVKTLDIDCTIPSSFVTMQNAKLMDWLEPFGEGNEKPVFAMSGVKVIEALAIGMDNKHLRLKIDAQGKVIDAVGFSFGEYAAYLKSGLFIDIAFNLDINEYMGTQKVQLVLKDIKSSKR